MDPAADPVYQNKVKPFMWICAAILPSVSETDIQMMYMCLHS